MTVGRDVDLGVLPGGTRTRNVSPAERPAGTFTCETARVAACGRWFVCWRVGERVLVCVCVCVCWVCVDRCVRVSVFVRVGKRTGVHSQGAVLKVPRLTYSNQKKGDYLESGTRVSVDRRNTRDQRTPRSSISMLYAKTGHGSQRRVARRESESTAL
eukprot:6173287-Pleurochrysis_carterae.AAC.6